MSAQRDSDAEMALAVAVVELLLLVYPYTRYLGLHTHGDNSSMKYRRRQASSTLASGWNVELPGVLVIPGEIWFTSNGLPWLAPILPPDIGESCWIPTAADTRASNPLIGISWNDQAETPSSRAGRVDIASSVASSGWVFVPCPSSPGIPGEIAV